MTNSVTTNLYECEGTTIKRFRGVTLCLDMMDFKLSDRLRFAYPKVDTVDVEITWHGQSYRFTWAEFCERLGLA